MSKLVKTAALITAGLLGTNALSTVAGEDFYITTSYNFNTDVTEPTSTASMNELEDAYWSTTVITDNGDGIFSAGDTTLGSGGIENIPQGIGTNDLNDNLISGFLPAGSSNNYLDNDGFSDTWIMTFGWTDLFGTVVEIAPGVGSIFYTSGTINVYYADTLSDASKVAVDQVYPTDFTKVLSLSVTAGGGNSIGQSLNLGGIVTYTDPSVAGFNWASDGAAFEAMAVSFLADQNTDPFWLNGAEGVVPGIGDSIFDENGVAVLSGRHNGSVSFNRRVPEPATLALVGLGLLGMTRLSKKRTARA